MSGHGVSESVIEQAALVWLEALGDAVLQAQAIAAGTLRVQPAERLLRKAPR